MQRSTACVVALKYVAKPGPTSKGADPVSAVRAPFSLIYAAFDCWCSPLEGRSKARGNGHGSRSTRPLVRQVRRVVVGPVPEAVLRLVLVSLDLRARAVDLMRRRPELAGVNLPRAPLNRPRPLDAAPPRRTVRGRAASRPRRRRGPVLRSRAVWCVGAVFGRVQVDGAAAARSDRARRRRAAKREYWRGDR